MATGSRGVTMGGGGEFGLELPLLPKPLISKFVMWCIWRSWSDLFKKNRDLMYFKKKIRLCNLNNLNFETVTIDHRYIISRWNFPCLSKYSKNRPKNNLKCKASTKKAEYDGFMANISRCKSCLVQLEQYHQNVPLRKIRIYNVNRCSYEFLVQYELKYIEGQIIAQI